MICIVKCPKKACIKIPSGINKNKGEEVFCPSSCPWKRSMCAKLKSFKVVATFQRENSDNSCFAYTEDEIVKYFNVQQQNVSTHSEDNNTITNSLESAEPLKMVQTAARYGTFGVASRETVQDLRDEYMSCNEAITSFNYGGVIYTDIRPKPKDAKKLKNALFDLFQYWAIGEVFESITTLKPKFVWLLVKTSRTQIRRAIVDAILHNDEYSFSQKFFHLFYDVVFKNDPPNGFYWSDSRDSYVPLIAVFKDREDFVEKYCDPTSNGVVFRLFYKARKAEIIHYFGCESEETLFDNMPLEFATKEGKIVSIDSSKEYTPIYLGSIEDFQGNMHQPGDLNRMQDMCHFLKKFMVTPRGVFKRSSDPGSQFERSERENLVEDASMFEPLKMTSAARGTEYNCFVSLLREYIKAYSPNEIRIGGIIFSKNSYTTEIQNIVLNLCKTHFSPDRIDDYEIIKGQAWLVKSLYERKILHDFSGTNSLHGFHCENERSINALMSLIEQPSVQKYIETFDRPVIRIGTTDYAFGQLVEKMLDEPLLTFCEKMRNFEFVRIYLSVKMSKISDKNQKVIDDALAKYQEQYEDFLNN